METTEIIESPSNTEILKESFEEKPFDWNTFDWNTFNWIVYRELNPQLNNLTTESDYERHFQRHGLKNGLKYRMEQIYPTFNYQEYRDLNPCLLYCNEKLITPEDYEINYLTNGRYKGRFFEKILMDIYKEKSVSIHVFLPTIGRSSIINVLNSLRYQLSYNDFLTIVYDGKKYSDNINIVRAITSEFRCSVNILVDNVNLGFNGYGIRNKYNRLEGDFVFHIGDNDIIYDNAINIIKNICVDNNIIYVFKVLLKNGYSAWKKKNIIEDEISTSSGIIPTKYNYESTWKLHEDGNYRFYKELYKKYNMIFIDKIICEKN